MGGQIFEMETGAGILRGHPAVFFTALGMVPQSYGGSRGGFTGFFDGSGVARLELVHMGKI